MTLPTAARKIRPGQRAGVMALRTMMGLFGSLASLRRQAPAGKVTEYAYGPHPDERIEFIERRAESPARAPVVYIHGGGWIAGKKELYTAELRFLGDAGYPVFNLEYPMAPERPHPHMLLSLLSALSWIREQNPEYASVHLMGDSAGGNLALMLGILIENPSRIEELEPAASPNLPRALSVVSIYGVLDRLSWIEHGFPGGRLMLECYAGPEAFEPVVGPERAITPMDLTFDSLPPTFISAGSKDQLAESSRLCASHLQERFDSVSYQVYPGEAHGFFNRSGRPASQQLRSDILSFLSKH